jgi:hypothetical protein
MNNAGRFRMCAKRPVFQLENANGALPQKWTFNAEKRDNQEMFSYKTASARYGLSPHRLVVQVSGGALTRTSSVTPSNKG